MIKAPPLSLHMQSVRRLNRKATACPKKGVRYSHYGGMFEHEKAIHAVVE